MRDFFKMALAKLRKSLTTAPSPSAALMGVWFAVGLHALWAAMLLAGQKSVENVTSVHELALLFPNDRGLAIVLVSVAGCALYGILKKGITMSARVALLVPQQLALGISAAGAAHAMIAGHFADGVPRPHVFLVADQAPAILALVVHSATILWLGISTHWVTHKAVITTEAR